MNLADRRRISGYLLAGGIVALLLWIPAFWYCWGEWRRPSLLHVLTWHWCVGLLTLSILLIVASELISPKFWEGRNRFTTPTDDENHRLHLDPDTQKSARPKD